MPRRLTVTDGYAFINAMADEMLGQNATIQAVNTSTFASVGETILRAGTENVINTLALVASRNLIAIRPYTAKFKIINALNSGMFSNRISKISYYAKNAVPTGASNTQLFTNLNQDFDNGQNPNGGGVPQSTESQWLQSQPIAHQAWFGGAIEWQYPYTLYENALKLAFNSPEEFTAFLNGFLVSVSNDIETEKEAFSRLTFLNAMAGVFDMTANMPGSAVNLTAGFNAKFGTNYTTAVLLQQHFPELLAYFVSTFKTISDKMENRSTLYHWSPAKTVNGVSYVLPRQTAKADQRLIMNAEFWNDAEALVLPQIFNDQYLKLENFEKIDYWQNINEPQKINITPAIPDVSDPTQQIAGAQVQQSVVLGMLFDRDAIMVDFHLEDVSSTTKEARKHYRTIWNTINKNPLNDFTENMVVFYLSD